MNQRFTCNSKTFFGSALINVRFFLMLSDEREKDFRLSDRTLLVIRLNKSVKIFICTLLPSAVRVCKIYIAV